MISKRFQLFKYLRRQYRRNPWKFICDAAAFIFLITTWGAVIALVLSSCGNPMPPGKVGHMIMQLPDTLRIDSAILRDHDTAVAREGIDQ